MHVTALIVAAGSGSRMGDGLPKQYRPLGGKAVLAHAVDALAAHPRIGSVRVVIGQGQEQLAETALSGRDVGPLIVGGAERADSVRAGLAAIEGDAILVHDAARPFCPPSVVDRLLTALADDVAAVPALPIADTLATAGGDLGDPVDRSNLVRVQTPQAFRLDSLIDAYSQWTGPSPTDESTVVRGAGLRVALVEGDPALEKLTTAADFVRAEQMLASRLTPRTGLGYDVHAFAGEGPVMMGGIPIPHERGLAGHSDADVLLHAICDALLGAAALGDIGRHFPDSDARYKGIDSRELLRHVAALLEEKGLAVVNVDATIIAQAPRMAPHVARMVANIAADLGVAPAAVNVKATTTEGLGFAGRGEGIAAQAICLVE
jgi:2-C-methyl-D-erythritol 4-phosphate cytidylyltransferase/2-C-methyl-D-erythritol 2,4-cyclodiphosphate synthase